VRAEVEALRTGLAVAFDGLAARSGAADAAPSTGQGKEPVQDATGRPHPSADGDVERSHGAVSAAAAAAADAAREACAAELGPAVRRLDDQVRALRAAVAGSAPLSDAFAGGASTAGTGAVVGVAGCGGAAASVRAVLRAVYEARTAGVDWLLAANGARVLDASPTYSGGGGGGWLRSGQRGAGPEALLRAAVEEPAAVAVAAAAHGSGGVEPGRCWAMAGARGHVTVRLVRPVAPRRLVLQHIPARVSANGCRSAPAAFRLVGFRAPPPAGAAGARASGPPAGDEVELVRGPYAVDPAGAVAAGAAGAGPAFGVPDDIHGHLQAFDIQLPAAAPVWVDRVRLYVDSNHGDEGFTCLYHPVLYGDASSIH
jgi:hypothetical protein